MRRQALSARIGDTVGEAIARVGFAVAFVVFMAMMAAWGAWKILRHGRAGLNNVRARWS